MDYDEIARGGNPSSLKEHLSVSYYSLLNWIIASSVTGWISYSQNLENNIILKLSKCHADQSASVHAFHQSSGVLVQLSELGLVLALSRWRS